MNVRCNMIGAGRAGKAVMRALRPHGVTIGDVLTRSAQSAECAVRDLGEGRAARAMTGMQPASWWLIAVNDDAIAQVAQDLAGINVARPDDVIFHLSGMHSSRRLEPLIGRLASIHPLRSLAADSGKEGLRGAFCALEGDREAVQALSPPLAAAGARLVSVSPDHKTRYHAASVIASNAVTTLIAEAARIFEDAEIAPQQSLEMAVDLASGATANAARQGPGSALTGPVVRGDVATVEAHLAALNCHEAALYRQLAQRTLDLALKSGRLDDERAQAVEKALARHHEKVLRRNDDGV